jgi:hypothetical protein
MRRNGYSRSALNERLNIVLIREVASRWGAGTGCSDSTTHWGGAADRPHRRRLPQKHCERHLPERRTRESTRHGTTTLLAALNVLKGTVIGECRLRHRYQEFPGFLDSIDRSVDSTLDVHLVSRRRAAGSTDVHSDVRSRSVKRRPVNGFECKLPRSSLSAVASPGVSFVPLAVTARLSHPALAPRIDNPRKETAMNDPNPAFASHDSYLTALGKSQPEQQDRSLRRSSGSEHHLGRCRIRRRR